jgi:hypothetical protein
MTDYFKYGPAWVGASEDFDLEGAGIINEVSGGTLGHGYNVSLDNRLICAVDDIEEAERQLCLAMNLASYWPDCFYINERGNVTQIVPITNGVGWPE